MSVWVCVSLIALFSMGLSALSALYRLLIFSPFSARRSTGLFSLIDRIALGSFCAAFERNDICISCFVFTCFFTVSATLRRFVHFGGYISFGARVAMCLSALQSFRRLCVFESSVYQPNRQENIEETTKNIVEQKSLPQWFIDSFKVNKSNGSLFQEIYDYR